MLIFVITAIIFAPKGEVRVKNDEDYGLTGFDTAFPNDIEKDNSYKR